MSTLKAVRATVALGAFRFGDLLEGLRCVFRRRTVLGAISLDLFALSPVALIVLGGIATLLVVAAYLKLFPELRPMKEFPRPH